MVCHSQEHLRERFIKELSEDSLKISVREVKPIDAAQLPIELVIVCSIHFLEEPLVTIVFSSLNTSLLT